MHLVIDPASRKKQPIARGVLDYFPLAIAAVANLSYVGNEQHNPGQPMHWAREKSTDHADCVARHLIDRGKIDADGQRHSTKVAWRALALLQLELEAADQAALTATPQLLPASDDAQTATMSLPAPADYEFEQARQIVEDAAQAERDASIDFQSARDAELKLGANGRGGVIQNSEVRKIDLLTLLTMQAPAKIAKQIVEGISYSKTPFCKVRRVAYVAGPMRGFDQFNFPAFDDARDRLLKSGFDVISPADIDRGAGDENSDNQPLFCLRDFYSLFFLKLAIDRPYIAMLPGWESSTGAAAEFFLARWLGLSVLDARTLAPLNAQDIDTRKLLQSIRNFLIGQMAK